MIAVRSRRLMGGGWSVRCRRGLVVIVLIVVRAASVLIFVLVGGGDQPGLVVIVWIAVRMIPVVVVMSASPPEASSSPPATASPELARPQQTESRIAWKNPEWPLASAAAWLRITVRTVRAVRIVRTGVRSGSEKRERCLSWRWWMKEISKRPVVMPVMMPV